jgi:predicted ATPase
LLVPFEWVFPVPGLSLEASDGPGDAVELFLERAAAGASPLASDDRARVAAVCRGLDGMALAIELAAARVPSLGLDGIEAGLADRLRLLTGGRRPGDRHRSLRSTLDWSYALLETRPRGPAPSLGVRRVPFTSSMAAAVLAGWPPVTGYAVPTVLAGLADQSLLSRSQIRLRLATAPWKPSGSTASIGSATQMSRKRLGPSLGLVPARRHALQLPRSSEDVGDWRSAFDQIAD